ncbi:hypothetical protein ACWDA7_45100 [Streptomyces sp. NPDC001156]
MSATAPAAVLATRPAAPAVDRRVVSVPPSVPLGFRDGDCCDHPDGRSWRRVAGAWQPLTGRGWLGDPEVRLMLGRAVVDELVGHRFVPGMPGDRLLGGRLRSAEDLDWLNLRLAQWAAQYVYSHTEHRLVTMRDLVAAHDETAAHARLYRGRVTLRKTRRVLRAILPTTQMHACPTSWRRAACTPAAPAATPTCRRAGPRA